MRTYDIVCPSCQGKGTINPHDWLFANTQIQCPACEGRKVVVCHETNNGGGINWDKHYGKA